MGSSLRKLNGEAVLKLVVLLGFAAFFCITVQSGKSQLYVHPRIVPYMKFAVAAFVLIALFMLGDIFQPKRRKTSYVSYLFFIVPLFMAFSLPPKALDASSLSIQDIRMSQQAKGTSANEDASRGDRYGGLANGRTADDTVPDYSNADGTDTGAANPGGDIYRQNTLALQGDRVLISDDNFAGWIQELYGDLGKYEGKSVQITGFVFRNKDFKENEFVAARLMMSCCTADLQPVGLLCRYQNAPAMKDGDWFAVSGVIAKTEYQGQPMPCIQVQSAEKTDKPKNEYVYPY